MSVRTGWALSLHPPPRLGKQKVEDVPAMLLKPPTGTAQLLSRWHAASEQSGWPAHHQWWTAAVDALIDAMAGDAADPVAAAERLGCERATAGIRLRDSLADLDVGMELLKVRLTARARLAGAMSGGWADSVTGWLGRGQPSCVDSLTQLSTREYLATRLDELYSESPERVGVLRDRRVLAVVAVRPSPDSLVTERRMVGVGQVLSSVFSHGETRSRVAPNVAVALAFRDDSLNDLLVGLQLELSWSGLSASPAGARTWLEPLPPGIDQLAEFFDDLAR
ncbi:hypothetical protein M6D93_00955 [Jatrophihabitans telluris]|uniref:Uncharacterized protein n=1 Tax=Jatrophihabitans telluris TaxID=2038343 RepID=A0ABY4R0J8_9ACTN|nr:hypothetical protein [Jatrophihabitans telluris]UQX88584.1 hypothetical protein M6D93_00955 [Jatrophihabitans telluris]